MRSLLLTTLTFLISIISHAQSKPVIGGPCEGCEAIHEYGDRLLNSVDSLPKFLETEPKLKLSGTVYKKNGHTPSADVVLYIYHTNRKGIYEKQGNETGWARRHGHIRGWVKTDKDGRYTFYTFRPAAYPNGREAEHIHIIVKEPDINEYYIDDFLFENDPLLTSEKRRSRKNRGGSGIVAIRSDKGIPTIERDIILGMNIPNYP